jgi:hypothetical protein
MLRRQVLRGRPHTLARLTGERIHFAAGDNDCATTEPRRHGRCLRSRAARPAAASSPQGDADTQPEKFRKREAGITILPTPVPRFERGTLSRSMRGSMATLAPPVANGDEDASPGVAAGDLGSGRQRFPNANGVPDDASTPLVSHFARITSLGLPTATPRLAEATPSTLAVCGPYPGKTDSCLFRNSCFGQ